MGQQISLPFGKFDRFDFPSYLTGENRQAVESLQRIASGTETMNLYLWGGAGCGKSHLLQAVCTSASAHNKNPAYIPLNQFNDFSPDMLQGLEYQDLVCIDNLDSIAGDEDWELAIFHLFNRMREQQRALLISARTSPKGIAVKLPDLKSRLAWDNTYHLHPLTEVQQVQVLQQRAKSRGFDLSEEVAGYLLKRVARDLHSLFALLDKLDIASLEAQKKLTIPFVRQHLKELM